MQIFRLTSTISKILCGVKTGGSSRSIHDQSMWDLWRKSSTGIRFFSECEYLGFPLLI